MASFPVTIPVGVTVVPPTGGAAIPDGLSTVKVALSNWPQAARTIAMDVDISLDGGVNWQRLVSTNPQGGARAIGRDGTADTSVVVGPMPPGTNRLVRATLTVVGGSITTVLTITAS